MEYVCIDCPRRCGARRGDTLPAGFCASPALPRVARAAPHFGEEPCISGTHGSGAVFFTGCNLRCVFCQNREISRGGGGEPVTVERLRDILLRLRDQGVHTSIWSRPPTMPGRSVRRWTGWSWGSPWCGTAPATKTSPR